MVDLTDLVVPYVEVWQLRATLESPSRKIPYAVSGNAERSEGVAEGAEDVRREVRDVVVGEVKVSQVAEFGECPRNVVQPVPLEINKFENLDG